MDKIQSLDEVVVTATRSEILLEDSPIPTEVIGKKEIERLNLITMQDLLQAKGIQVAPMKSGGFQLRGLSSEYVLVMIDGVPRLADNQYVMFYKKNPVIMIMENSVEPISPTKLSQKSLTDGTNTTGYKILLAKMMSEGIVGKKQIPNLFKWGLGLILAGVIGYALMTGGG